jgi:hypothetical protein
VVELPSQTEESHFKSHGTYSSKQPTKEKVRNKAQRVFKSHSKEEPDSPLTIHRNSSLDHLEEGAEIQNSLLYMDNLARKVY